ncbi:MAG: AbrB/MazE/SpoVT family DNA-binding domain-containing protein [Candidatus Methanofastidiosia archaeon]
MHVFSVGEDGTISLPTPFLESLEIEAGCKIIMTLQKNKIIIERFDKESVSELLTKELRGVEKEYIIKDTEEAVNDALRKEHPYLFD